MADLDIENESKFFFVKCQSKVSGEIVIWRLGKDKITFKATETYRYGLTLTLGRTREGGCQPHPPPPPKVSEWFS